VPFVEALTKFTVAELPASTLEKAQLCVVDFLSCAFAARKLPWAGHAIAVAQRWPAADGACSLRVRSDLRCRGAFVNSVMAASASRTDMHPASTAHPAPVVFPVALALASLHAVSGAEFIAAVVAGYEAIGRLGRIMVNERFRSHFRATACSARSAARLRRQEFSGWIRSMRYMLLRSRPIPRRA